MTHTPDPALVHKIAADVIKAEFKTFDIDGGAIDDALTEHLDLPADQYDALLEAVGTAVGEATITATWEPSTP
ncbi:hypothetical protein ACIBI8_37095 [Streptomyces sp. NPDC050529]|uniref:hypothetical protein n=1 Tax=Streptomyces sp. NPDC050529 TaxID=3365624 RepID=UPI003796C130